MEAEEPKKGGGTEVLVTKKLAKKMAKTVRKTLDGACLHKMSEKKVREELSAVLDLDVDFSEEPYKSIVRRAVEDQLEYEVREGQAKRKARVFARARALAQQNDKNNQREKLGSTLRINCRKLMKLH